MFKLFVFLLILQQFSAFVQSLARNKRSEPGLTSPSAYVSIPQLAREHPFKMLKKIPKAYWNEDPEYDILSIISDWSIQMGNITLVGWQKIMNEDGTVKEVRTIELTLQGSTFQSENEIGTEDHHGLWLMLDDVIHLNNDVRKTLGLDIITSSQSYKYDGSLEFAYFVDSRDIYLPPSSVTNQPGFLIRNLTVASLDDVIEFKVKHKGTLPSSLLVWNSESDTINLSKSTIVPERKASVEDQVNATIDMIEDARKYVATAYLVDKENALEYIRTNMAKSFPKYNWFVTEDFGGYSGPRNVFIELNMWYNMLDFPISVSLFGVKNKI